MKKLILLITVCLPIMTLASEAIRLNGDYLYSHIEIAQVRLQELVPSLNTKRFNELVADKYNCALRGDFFLCQKVVRGVALPHLVESEITKAWINRFFAFIPSPFDPSLTNESDYLMEWDIFDAVRFDGFQVSEYHYWLLKNDNEVHKIALNFSSGERWINIVNEEKITTPLKKAIRINNFKSTIFELDLVFIRQ